MIHPLILLRVNNFYSYYSMSGWFNFNIQPRSWVSLYLIMFADHSLIIKRETEADFWIKEIIDFTDISFIFNILWSNP